MGAPSGCQTGDQAGGVVSSSIPYGPSHSHLQHIRNNFPCCGFINVATMKRFPLGPSKTFRIRRAKGNIKVS